MAYKEEEFTGDSNKRNPMQKEKDDKLFIKGFNAGYLLSHHEPDLLERLLQTPNKSDAYVDGMNNGKRQYDRDKVIKEINKIQSKSKDKEQEK